MLVHYEKEWRADPNKSGGGEIIDQGSHLIDLSRMFLGDFSNIKGLAHTFFWDMEVEDNGFMILQNEKNQVAFLHASCTEWKNLFSMELCHLFSLQMKKVMLNLEQNTL